MRLPNVLLSRVSVLKLAVLGAIGVTMAGGAFAAYSLTRNPAAAAPESAITSLTVVNPVMVCDFIRSKNFFSSSFSEAIKNPLSISLNNYHTYKNHIDLRTTPHPPQSKYLPSINPPIEVSLTSTSKANSSSTLTPPPLLPPSSYKQEYPKSPTSNEILQESSLCNWILPCY